jgi:hypothetical protein
MKMRIPAASFAAALSLAFVPAPFATSNALAQTQDSAQSGGAVEQILLTDQQVQNFLAAQKDMEEILQKIPQGSEEPDAKTLTELDAAAKKYNFANYTEYDLVGGNIGLVMSGIDPQTKKYIGTEAVLKQQIAAIEADKSLSPKDKTDALGDLTAQLKSVQPVKIPGNIDLVTKYYDKLAATAPQND